jgi:prepilin-type processing-associated H-X9-DG protein
LYTEYWWNDFHSDRCAPLLDSQLEPIRPVNGAVLEKLPAAQHAVPLAEYAMFNPPDRQRHTGGMHMGFADGHASFYLKRQFLDTDTADPQKKGDWDPYGCRPFWGWGTTRNGQNFGPN